MGLHGRSALLRLQSDERLITLIRRGNPAAFEVLVSRYQARLLAFCRHLLGSREDAEDVLQEALAAAFNAILADNRPINVRPWLYRIARNRCLNHLRRIQAVGVDSMDVHLSEHGTSTADKVHKLEEFWMLVGDIQELPETQKTALVLREMDALSYEQIAEAMETTVPSVKSLLVRARVSLAEAAEARMLSCEDVRIELAEAAEGLRKKQSPVVRRHLRSCERCSVFQVQLKETSKALTALLPIGPLVLLKKLVLTHLGHSAGTGATGAGAAGAGAAGQAAAVGSSAAAGSALVGSGSVVSAGVGAIAAKAAAGLAAAALVTAGAVEVSHDTRSAGRRAPAGAPAPAEPIVVPTHGVIRYAAPLAHHVARRARIAATASKARATKPAQTKAKTKASHDANIKAADRRPATATATAKETPAPGRTQSQTQTTVLASGQTSGTSSTSATDQSPTQPAPSDTATTQTTTSTTPTSTTTTDPGATPPVDGSTTTTGDGTQPPPSNTGGAGEPPTTDPSPTTAP